MTYFGIWLFLLFAISLSKIRIYLGNIHKYFLSRNFYGTGLRFESLFKTVHCAVLYQELLSKYCTTCAIFLCPNIAPLGGHFRYFFIPLCMNIYIVALYKMYIICILIYNLKLYFSIRVSKYNNTIQCCIHTDPSYLL